MVPWRKYGVKLRGEDKKRFISIIDYEIAPPYNPYFETILLNQIITEILGLGHGYTECIRFKAVL